MIPPPRFRRCITTTLSDSQLQSIERESANRSLFARELVVGTLSQTLPELTQHQQQMSGVETPASNTTTATSTPETPNANAILTSVHVLTKKQNSSTQDTKKDQGATASAASKSLVPTSTQQQQQQQQPHLVQTAVAATSVASGIPSQGLPSNPNGIAAAQNTPMVQTLMHSVLPQPLVLQQQQQQQQLPPPIRNTGTGTIREAIATPAPAYLRGGVGSVGVTTGPSRRKPVRAVDGRNQSTEPPPPH